MAAKTLRAIAEDAVRMTRQEISTLAVQDVQRLVHELQVHHIELDMQNEALRTTQRELEESQAQYRELFESAPAGYLMLDASGIIVRANVAAFMLLGTSRQSLTGHQLSLFVVAEDALALHEHLRSAQRDASATCEVRLKGPAESVIDVRLDTTIVPSPSAECLIVMTDVSERKRSVAALAGLNQELERRVAARTAEIERRNRQLEAEIQARIRSETERLALEERLREAQRLESLGLLAAGIAHDFNNLLVSVLGNADLLLIRRDLPEDCRDPLGLIKHACRSAADLTRQLLVFAGRGRVSTAAISLRHVVAESLQLLQTRVSTSIRLQTRIAEDVPEIQADRGQIQQLVMNLVTNAVEAIDTQGAIEIQASARVLDADALAQFQHRVAARPGRFAVLRVQDSGPGIEPTAVPRIFDPFFTTKFTGRGLGLATVLGVVQGHHGALRVQSRPGEGTSFEVAFPVAEVDGRAEHASTLGEQEWKGSGTVLLIDDDDTVREVIAGLLRALGFDVVAAHGGEAGLELFRHTETPFDFVVLDWLMPGLSGEHVLSVLHQLAPELAVILISGYSTEELAIHDERITRVQKPMTLAQLRDAVRAATSASLAAASPAKSPGENTHRAAKHGKPHVALASTHAAPALGSRAQNVSRARWRR